MDRREMAGLLLTVRALDTGKPNQSYLLTSRKNTSVDIFTTASVKFSASQKQLRIKQRHP